MNDLKLIKKHYGEEMMHLARELFPTILETPGLLFELFEQNFSRSRLLYKNLKKLYLEDDFKNYIYSLLSINEIRYVSDKDVNTLMKEAGYTLYECNTKEELLSFKKYYAPGEELCSFERNRLKSNYVFFAVKDNVEEINRKMFLHPERQDEYGTSVISIQFTKGSINTLSIKNRYNHTVEYCDSTFSNNLENIIPGLTNAFEKEYDLNINQNDCLNFELKGYKKANDKRYYKSNYEINNIHYCPDNVIINSKGEIEQEYLQKEKYLVIDYFIIDLVNKKIKLFDDTLNDSFLETFQNIKNIKILKNKNTKDIIIKNHNNEEITITINDENKIIKYTNKYLTTLEDNFLCHNDSLEEINVENVLNIENNVLYKNKELKSINLPYVKTIKDSFLENNLMLNRLYMPLLEEIGDKFLCKNICLKSLKLDNVKTIGNSFLSFNEILDKISLNSIEKIGNSFLYSNLNVKKLYFENLKEVGNNFFWKNKIINYIYIPNLEKTGNNFLLENNELTFINLPKLSKIGVCFMFYNQKIKYICLNNLKIIPDGFMYNNEEVEYLYLPTVISIGNNFMRYNEKLKVIILDNVKSIDNYFLENNLNITKLSLPLVEQIGNNFMLKNNILTYLYLPSLKRCGKRCLENKLKLLSDNTPKLETINDYNLNRIKTLKK